MKMHKASEKLRKRKKFDDSTKLGHQGLRISIYIAKMPVEPHFNAYVLASVVLLCVGENPATRPFLDSIGDIATTAMRCVHPHFVAHRFPLSSTLGRTAELTGVQFFSTSG